MPFKPGHRNRSTGSASKISSLPLDIRAELNRRIADGQNTLEITAWLNAHETVRKIMDEKWKGLPFLRQNVGLWRRTGYKEWQRRLEKVEHLKQLSEYALKLGQAAGGSVADGTAAIAGGKIMAALETASGEDVHKIVRSISALRAGDINKARLAQQDKKLELERQRFQRQTAELFLKWYEDKRARAIVESRDSNADKIELLGRAMFGEDW